MPKHRMRAVERKEKALFITDLPCASLARKILQSSLRLSRPKTTCHDIVVECAGPVGHKDSRLRVRAICTTPKSRSEFEAMAEGYAESVKGMI